MPPKTKIFCLYDIKFNLFGLLLPIINKFTPIIINNSEVNVFGDCYSYVPGDVNGDGLVIGSDVTFLVNYFRGIVTPRPEQIFGPDNFWAGADANGDCQIIGSDVTYLVNYFRGVNDEIRYCVQYLPCST